MNTREPVRTENRNRPPIVARPSIAELQAREVAKQAVDRPVQWNPATPTPERAVKPAAEPRTQPLPSSGGGEQLGPQTRALFEERLGFDLGRVRIHRDPAAERAAARREANAFAVGSDIYFGAGTYQPMTTEGQKLLAHELVHTVQQQRSGIFREQRDEKAEARKKKKAEAMAAAQEDANREAVRAEIAQMTDEEKSLLRGRIEERAQSLTQKVLARIDELPALDQLSADDQAKVKALRTALNDARPGAAKTADAADRDLRLGVIDATKAMLDDKYFVYYFLASPGVINLESLAAMGDGSVAADAETQAQWQHDLNVVKGGGRGVIAYNELLGVFHEAHIDDPSLLKTEESNDFETGGDAGSGGGEGSGGLTTEDRARLQELFEANPDGADRAVLDEEAVAEQLRQMSAEELTQLKEYLKHAQPPDGAEVETLEDLLARFHALTPAEREALLVNQSMPRQDSEAPKLGGKILLQLGEQTTQDAKAMELARQADSSMELLLSKLSDPEKMKNYHPIALDLGLFTTELAFIRGFLAGGASRSPLVAGAVTDLTAEMARVQGVLMEQIAAELLVMGALAGATYLSSGLAAPATATKILASLAKLEQLRRKLEQVRRAFAVLDQVKHFLDLVASAPAAIEEFRGVWARVGALYQEYRPLLEDVDQLPDDVDDQLAQMEDELAEKFDDLLETKFGDVLEMLYLDPAMPPAQLFDVILELPLGIDALADARDFYLAMDSSSEGAAERVAIRAARAGMLLYPLVGFLAAFAAEQFGAAFPDQDFSERIIGALGRYERDKSKRKSANRSSFFRLNRRNYEYNENDLRPFLDEGEKRLNVLLEDEEPGQHWTTGWLRYSMREELQTLNQEFSSKKITAKVKPKKKGKTAKGPAPAGAATESVPLPPFRLSFSHLDRSSKREEVKLSLNPAKPIWKDLISNDDFKTTGVPYVVKGRKKRERAMRAWLEDHDYEVTQDNHGKPHLRLKGGLTDAGKRQYLHIDDTVDPPLIRAGIRESDHANFVGRVIQDSRDLPEGYVLKEGGTVAYVSRKEGLGKSTTMANLGLNAAGELTVDAKEKLGPQDLGAHVPDPVSEPTDLESYRWEDAISDTVSFDYYNTQGANEALWRKRADANPALKQRPKSVRGNLGYILRARAHGDKLGSAHLPQLKDNDDKGHLIAKRFGGTDNVQNLIPMKRSLNQFPGKWFDLESDVAKTYTGKAKQPGHYAWMSIDLSYPNAGSRRPSRFAVAWKEKDAAGKDVAARGTKGKESFSND